MTQRVSLFLGINKSYVEPPVKKKQPKKTLQGNLRNTIGWEMMKCGFIRLYKEGLHIKIIGAELGINQHWIRVLKAELIESGRISERDRFYRASKYQRDIIDTATLLRSHGHKYRYIQEHLSRNFNVELSQGHLANWVHIEDEIRKRENANNKRKRMLCNDWQ